MKKFERENRYIVLKRKHLGSLPSALQVRLKPALEEAAQLMPKLECLVIESDWPEYEPTWQAIEDRMSAPKAPGSLPGVVQLPGGMDGEFYAVVPPTVAREAAKADAAWQMREEFEAAYSRDAAGGLPVAFIELQRLSNGSYAVPKIATAWRWWQASRAALVVDRGAVRDAVAVALGDALDCTRVWSAWGVGTMSQDDFRLVTEDDARLDEITDAAIEAAGLRVAK